MNRDVLATAVEMVQRSGDEVTPYRVHQALRHLGESDTSYQQVFDALQVQASTSAAEVEGEEDDAPPERAEEAHASDTLDEAGAALARAQAQVAALEGQRPILEAAIEPAREAVLQAVMRQLAAKECRWRGYWPVEDEAVLQALEAEVHTLAYREVRQRLAALPAQLEAARAAVRVAQQQVWLARERPELVDALTSVQAVEPMDTQDSTASYRQRAQWKQRVAVVRAQMAQALAEARV